MSIKIKQLILSISLFFTCMFGILPAVALAQTDCDANGDGVVSAQEAIQCGASGASGNNQTPDEAGTNVNGAIKELINLLSVAAGIVAVIMIIIAGLRYVTSGGKQESVSAAKNSLLYAVIGLVIVAVAQLIVHFVLRNVT